VYCVSGIMHCGKFVWGNTETKADRVRSMMGQDGLVRYAARVVRGAAQVELIIFTDTILSCMAFALLIGDYAVGQPSSPLSERARRRVCTGSFCSVYTGVRFALATPGATPRAPAAACMGPRRHAWVRQSPMCDTPPQT